MYLLLFGKYLDTTNITLDRLVHRFAGTNEGVVISLHQLYIRPRLEIYTLDPQHNPEQTSSYTNPTLAPPQRLQESQACAF
jgi:hypothetical protein